MISQGFSNKRHTSFVMNVVGYYFINERHAVNYNQAYTVIYPLKFPLPTYDPSLLS